MAAIDPETGVRAARNHEDGPTVKPFVGRENEMAALRAGMEDAFSGRGRLMLLVGEPGIGKTRTAQELETWVRLRGGLVLWGRCYEGEGAPPYWPWVQVIRSYVREKDPEELAAAMGAGAADVAEVVPEVRERLPGLPTAPELEPAAARFRLFDSIATFLKNASRPEPVLLVLDDLQWADKPSLLLLELLAREMRDCRLLVLGTYRDAELGRRHPLTETLAELARHEQGERVLLRGLGETEVARYVETTGGLEASGELVARVYKETEGNPFFVKEVVHMLAAEGGVHRDRAQGALEARLPASVREVVGRRLNRLSEECNQVLTLAAVMGREFGLSALERVGEIQGEPLLQALDEAVAARFLDEVNGRAGRYSFSHALFWHTLYAELTTGQRVRLHQRIGEELEALYGDRAEEHAAELAYHFGKAAVVAGPEKLARYATAAGKQAASVYAWEEAERNFEMALAAKEGQPLDAETADISYRLGRSLLALDQPRNAWRHLRRALTFYIQADDSAGAVAVVEAMCSHPGLVAPTQTQAIEQVLALVAEDSLEFGRLQACLGYSLGTQGDYERAKEAFGRALNLARRHGDRRGEMEALSRATTVEANHQHDARDALLRVVELARELDVARQEWGAHVILAAIYVARGDLEAAQRHADAALEVAERQRVRASLGYARLAQAECAAYRGEWDSALRYVEAGFQPAPRSPPLLHVGFSVHLLRGDLEGAASYRERLEKVAAAAFPGVEALSYTSLTLAEEAWATGAEDIAERARDLAEGAISSRLPWSTPHFLYAARHALGLLAVLGGDRDAAEREYAALALYSGRIEAERIRGLLAATMGRLDEAISHFDTALAFGARGYRPCYAQTAYDCTRVLLKRRAKGDHGRALGLLDEALDLSRELGMSPLLKRCLDLLGTEMDDAEDAKTRLESLREVVAQGEAWPGLGAEEFRLGGKGGPPHRVRGHPDGLSDREVDVLRLVAAGRTNSQIAQELVISRNTVERHMNHLFAKTGVNTRVELALYAQRAALID